MLPLRGQSGPGSDSNKEVLHIPQSSSITGISPSDCLVSYPGHWPGVCVGGGTYPYAEVQLVYSTAPANWASGLFSAKSFCVHVLSNPSAQAGCNMRSIF